MVVSVGLALAVAVASAEGAPSLDLPDLELPSRSFVTLTLGGARDRERDADETVRSGWASLRGGTTLLGRASLDAEGRPRAWGLVGEAGARAFTADLPVIEGDRSFFRIGSSLGAFYLSPARNLYWLQAGAFVAEQGALLGSPRLHPFGRVLGTARASDAVIVLYGVGYTYDYGRGLPLPFLGVGWRWAPEWRLDVLLPVAARVSWRTSEAITAAFGATVAGDVFRYRAAGDPDVEILRIARLRLGASVRYALSRRTHVGLEVGVEGASIDTGPTTQTGGGGYLQLSFGFRSGDGP